MSHDLAAELGGYRNELVIAERGNRPDRLKAIRGEIRRVTAVIEHEAAGADDRAKVLDATGQGVLAARARERAAELRSALAAEAVVELPADDPTVPGEPETKQDTTPRETAVSKKAASR